jgi:hypothetical protein
MLLLTNANSQIIQWQKCLGGTGWDQNIGTSNIRQTSDGGYIVVGQTLSNDGDVSGNHGDADVWAVKLDNSGSITWQECYGSSFQEFAKSVYPTGDGGYIIAGGAVNNGGQVSGIIGDYDIWVIKINSTGNLQWQKCLGGYATELVYNIQSTNDGGYILSANTTSNTVNVSGNHGSSDAWIVKLDVNGNILWQKCLGGTGDDAARFIRQTPDHGYVLAALTNSTDGDVTGVHGMNDIWIVRLDTVGNIQWQKCFGGSGLEQVYSIEATSDGGYVFCGSTESNDGDITGYNDNGSMDAWIVKLNSSGNLVWQKCLGGESDEEILSIVQTADGNYVGAGYTTSLDDGVDTNIVDVVNGNNGASDYWIVKLDNAGNLSGQLCLGSSLSENAYYIQQTSDGGYITGGMTFNGNDGDVSGGHGGYDLWIVKLGNTLSLQKEIPAANIKVYPNPTSGMVNLDLNNLAQNEIFIQITDITGHIVFSKTYQNSNIMQMDMTGYVSGIYTYRIICAGKPVQSGKIIYNK